MATKRSLKVLKKAKFKLEQNETRRIPKCDSYELFLLLKGEKVILQCFVMTDRDMHYCRKYYMGGHFGSIRMVDF